jgi:hypothetical protein
MGRSKRDWQDTEHMLNRLTSLGISRADAETLRRIAMTLHRWHELECGSEHGAIERDEETGKPYWLNAMTGKRSYQVPDREAGAKMRLSRVMARYPNLNAYIQGDPRGASLYILRPGDVPEGKEADSYYNNGIAVFQ